jgi:hypothetical protein
MATIEASALSEGLKQIRAAVYLRHTPEAQQSAERIQVLVDEMKDMLDHLAAELAVVFEEPEEPETPEGPPPEPPEDEDGEPVTRSAA